MKDNQPFKVHQEREVRRFSLLNVGSSIMELLNLEFGLLYTIKEFLLRPADSMRSYLAEGRLNYFSPFRLLFLSTAILLIAFQSLDMSEQFEQGFQIGANGSIRQMEDNTKAEAALALSKRIFSLIQEYFNILIWLYIPVLSFFTWIGNRKAGLNFAEHIVFNTWYTAIVNFFVLLLFIGNWLGAGTFVTWLYTILSLFYFTWFYHDLFKKSWLRAFFEGLGMSLISAFIYTFGLGILFGMALAKGWIG